MKIFSLDLDNTLLDFSSHFKAYVEPLGYNLDISQYDCGFEDRSKLMELILQHYKAGQLANLCLIEPDVEAFLQDFYVRNTVLFTTVRGTLIKDRFSYNSALYLKVVNDTYYSLSQWFKYPSVRHTENKCAVHCDYHVDDNPREYEKFKNAGLLHKFILYRQPYNKHITDCNVIQSIKELENYE